MAGTPTQPTVTIHVKGFPVSSLKRLREYHGLFGITATGAEVLTWAATSWLLHLEADRVVRDRGRAA